MTTPAITAIAPWYGSNRQLAHEVGRRLRGCRWVGIPFAGGMCELTTLADNELPRTIVAGDLHAHVLNLAAVIADEKLNAELRSATLKVPFHSEILKTAQDWCRRHELKESEPWFGVVEGYHISFEWALNYFISVWMARNGTAGTANEFKAPLSVRWEAGGGDSCTRFRNAADGLEAWQHIMRRCTFVRLDVFAFLDRANDQADNGLYLDPPFPGPGDDYKFTFSIEDHARLMMTLDDFDHARIVCRFYDHPLIRKLYPESTWTWEFLEGGKTQTNQEAPEVLISRRVPK